MRVWNSEQLMCQLLVYGFIFSGMPLVSSLQTKSCPYPLSTIILFTFLLVLELASAVAQGVKAQAAFQITYPTLLKAATGQCAYFHSNSSPAQHSQIGHPLPSPAKQTKTRKKTLLITQPPPAEFFYDDVHPASGPRSSR